MCFQDLWPFHCFCFESLRKQDLQNQTQTSQSFLYMYGHLDKGAGAHSNCTVAFRKPSEKLGFHCFCHSCIRYWMRHSKCESESGPGFKVRMWHFMYLCVFSFRAFPKEYSNFESVNMTMFNRFKFKVVKHVYGDAPKMFKCLKSNRLNLFCWSCHMGHWRVNTC